MGFLSNLLGNAPQAGSPLALSNKAIERAKKRMDKALPKTNYFDPRGKLIRKMLHGKRMQISCYHLKTD